MYKEKTIAVVVPAYNEEKLIGQVIETMPEFVDKIIIINDCSKDNTSKIVKILQAKIPDRLLLIEHKINQGVGGAIVTGYKWCRDNHMDVSVVMAGDAQMAPSDLPALLDPVVANETDYAKGNRLISGEAWEKIPHIRYLGNASLSMLTKIASGYWHVADSQTGYTAVNLRVLQTLDLDKIYKRYGMPNDMLVRLNIYNFRVRDIEIHPVYGIGEKSGIHPLLIIPKLLWLILTLFIKRMNQKYIIRDFHPLVFFYITGILLTSGGLIFGAYLALYRIFIGSLRDNSLLFATFLFLSGWQFQLFAMWFDMEYNKNLK
jgi:glycosyltransferase involved in cell wall biosynthesis